jgi:uncharacterized membrane protein
MRIGKLLAVAATIAYPFLVLACLLVFKVSARGIGLCLLAVAALNFLTSSGADGGSAGRARKWGALGLSLALVALVFATDDPLFAKLYPVIVSLTLLALFGFSLISPPTAVFRLAALRDKSLREPGPDRDKAEPYCRKVTIVWCCFFVINGSIALCTALFASPVAWSVYNGFVSYLLMGALFLGETIARRRAMRS